jgi:hypothetical protein
VTLGLDGANGERCEDGFGGLEEERHAPNHGRILEQENARDPPARVSIFEEKGALEM